MARKSMIGNKVRRMRRLQGLSQVRMAEQLEISPSYLNLIEHNRRSINPTLLKKIALVLDADIQALSDDDESRLMAELVEIMGNPLFNHHEITSEDFFELASSMPSLGRAFLSLYADLGHAQENVNTLSERLSDNAYLSSSIHELLTLLTSIRSFSEILHDNVDLASGERQRFLSILVDESEHLKDVINRLQELTQGSGIRELLGARPVSEEVSDFIDGHGNYFDEIESLAESLHGQIGLANGPLHEGLRRVLSSRFGLSVESASWEAQQGSECLHDTDGGRILISEELPPYGVSFQLARQIGLLSLEEMFAKLLDDTRFSTQELRSKCRDALAKYFAGAVLMPYRPFLEAARSMRHDIELLQHRFAVGFEQVCHRLTTLRRPGAAGIPFHFLRIDIAGNILKRYGGSGMRIPRFGGACPRWNIHAAFMTPNMIHSQLARMPEGDTFFCIARTLMKRGGGYKTPISHLAIGIGCEASHAQSMVYADGFDLENLDAAVPVGVSCRLCERLECRQRAFPFLFVRTDQAAAGSSGGRLPGVN